MRRQLLENKAGNLDFYPPESRALDGDATLNVYIDGSSLWSGTFPATVVQDAASCTLAATSLGARELTASTATTDFKVGRRYVVESTRQERWEGTLAGKDSTTLIFTEPIPFALAVGSTCKGLLLRYSPAAEDTAQRYRMLRAVYDYEIDGDPIQHVFFFDVVKQRYGVTLSLSYLQQHWSSIRQHLGHSGDVDWQGITERAVDTVYTSLENEDFFPDLIREQEALKPWAALLAIEQILAELSANGTVSPDLAAYYTRQAGLARERLITNPKRWYDSGDSLTGTQRGAQFADSDGTWQEAGGDDAWGNDFGLRPKADPVI